MSNKTKLTVRVLMVVFAALLAVMTTGCATGEPGFRQDLRQFEQRVEKH
jgi:hypothetical protein